MTDRNAPRQLAQRLKANVCRRACTAGLFALLIMLGAAGYLLCSEDDAQDEPVLRDYPQIAREGILRAAVEYGTISMYADGDTLAGFNYELLQAFCRDHGLKAEIIPEVSYDKCLEGLARGTYDLLAFGITATTAVKDTLLTTIPVSSDRLALVQRRPAYSGDNTYIRNQLDLAGKTIHLPKGSPAIMRIHNLGREIGDTIYVEEVELYGPEQLVALVAHGDIDYTACDESLAEALAVEMPQTDNSILLGFSHLNAWAAGRHSPILTDTLDAWIEAFRRTPGYEKIYRKHYRVKPPAYWPLPSS